MFFKQKIDKDINSWNTGKVQSMTFMFSFARKFDQDINFWNTGKVETMSIYFMKQQFFTKILIP